MLIFSILGTGAIPILASAPNAPTAIIGAVLALIVVIGSASATAVVGSISTIAIDGSTPGAATATDGSRR